MNHTLRDLHVEWTQDTHQPPQWDFIRHNKGASHPSRKVITTASFTLTLYKNRGGKPGVKLGSFRVKVYTRTSGEIIATKIGKYAHLTFLDAEGAAIFIAKILWTVWT